MLPRLYLGGGKREMCGRERVECHLSQCCSRERLERDCGGGGGRDFSSITKLLPVVPEGPKWCPWRNSNNILA
jgi:hypothetical protein